MDTNFMDNLTQCKNMYNYDRLQFALIKTLRMLYIMKVIKSYKANLYSAPIWDVLQGSHSESYLPSLPSRRASLSIGCKVK